MAIVHPVRNLSGLMIASIGGFLLCGSVVLSASSGDAPAPACEAFSAWAAQGTALHPSQTMPETDLNRGVELAKVRRQELKTLMQRDPAAALRQAIGSADKALLPQAVADELEDEVSGVGYVGPLVAAPASDPEAGPSASMTINGEVLRIFLHGSQLQRKQWYGERVRGVALDGLAVLEDAAGDVAVAALAPVASRDVQTKTITRSYDPAGVTITREGAYDRIAGEGLECMGDEPGTPELPAEVVHIAIPSGAEVKGFRVRFKEEMLQEGVFPYPLQPFVPMSQTNMPAFMPPKPEAYKLADPFPAEMALLKGDQNRMGHRFVSIQINPLRYTGATKTLLIAREVTVDVDYVLPFITPTARTGRVVQEAHESVKAMVVNPGEVESPLSAPAPVKPLAEPMDEPTLVPETEPVSIIEADASGDGVIPTGTGDVDYLIITSDTLASAFTNLALHRQTFNGFATEVKTVASITSTYTGKDTQAKIRACIIDYFTTRNLSYVVLGGDNTVVATRSCYVTWEMQNMPTDLYYSGLDGTWDADNDGIYGEVHTYPALLVDADMAYDVIVGRIPVRTASQANAYINKVIRYDNNPPYSIARKVMASGHTCWDSYSSTTRPLDLMNDGHRQFQDSKHPSVSDSEIWERRLYRDFAQSNTWESATQGYLFNTLSSWDGTSNAGTYPASAANMVTTFNQGWNIVRNLTHGNTDIWATESGYFDVTSANSLTNLTAFLYTGACLSGGFDQGEPSLSEAMLRNPIGGALVYLGCNRYNWGNPGSYYGGPGSEYAAKWFSQLFGARERLAGKAFAEHKLAMIEKCNSDNYYKWIQYGINLQGDPALRIIGLYPSVSVEATDMLATEGGNDFGHFVVRRAPATGSLTVSVSYSGTAMVSGGSSDIMGTLPVALTFANGESEKIISVTPLADAINEQDETIILSLVADEIYEVEPQNTATIRIVGDDPAVLPVVTVIATDAFASEQDFDPGVFTFTRTGFAADALTVHYLISGSASAADYAPALSGAITFDAGQTATNIMITAVDDVLAEGPEELTLTIQPAMIFEIAVAEATIALADNERPVVTVATIDSSARENSSDTGTFRISRTADTALPLVVNVSTAGTSVAGSDYVAISSLVTIPSGASYVDVPVVTINDSVFEVNETVVFTLLADLDYYVLGAVTQAEVTVLDDDNLYPIVSLISPPNGATFAVGEPVTLMAQAGDDWGIGKVEFLAGATVLATDITSPYQSVVSLSPGTYAISARAIDTHSAVTTSSVVNITVSSISNGPGNGYYLQVWTNGYYYSLSALTSSTNYPDNPHFSVDRTTQTLSYSLGKDRYGTRIRTWFIAPVDGNYTFYCAADDMARFWLSSDEQPSNVVEIAYFDGWNIPGINTWPSSKSVSKQLVGGRKYYLESIQTDYSGGDYVQVGVVLPNGQYERPIPAHRLELWRELRVVASTNAVTVPEEGTAQFEIALSQAPTGTVNVTVHRSGGITTISPTGTTNVIFDSGNWNVPQTVTVSAVADTDAVAGVAYIRCASPLAESAIVQMNETETDTNSPPVANADIYEMIEGSTLAIAAPGVLGNDSDPESNSLTPVLVSDVNNGVLTLNATGSFTYTPVEGWSGADSFTYQANDGLANSALATVLIAVTARPKVVSATSVMTRRELQVAFNTPVTPATAERLANYALDNGVVVQSVELQADMKTLKLVTSDMNYGREYVLAIDSITASDGTTMTPNAQVAFTCQGDAYAEYAYRTRITFAGYDRSEPLVDFPVLVTFGPHLPGFSYDQMASTNGWDLRFSDMAMTTTLSYEIESWDTNGTSSVWVKMPVFAGTNTPIMAYWGNTNASQERDPAIMHGAVWPSSFRSVNHFGQEYGNALDATANGYTATDANASIINGVGVVGRAALIDGSTDCFLITAVPGDVLTVSMWYYFQATGGSIRNLLGSARTSSPVYEHLQVRESDGHVGANVNGTFQSWGVSLPKDQWSHLTLSMNGESFALSVNGQPAASGTVFNNNTYRLRSIGAYNWYNGIQAPAYGAIDEVRISTVAYSTNWIWATYMNMASNVTFNGYDSVLSMENLAPDAVDDFHAIDEDTVLTVAAAQGVLANDWDREGEPFTLTLVNPPVNGDLTLDSDGSFTYEPEVEFSGMDSFVYSISDGHQASQASQATVTILVNEIDDPPVLTLVSPTNHSVFAVGDDIPMMVTFLDTDSLCTQVVFYANSDTRLGIMGGCPATLVWNTPPVGEHLLWGVCNNSSGQTATSAVIRVSVVDSTNAVPVAMAESFTLLSDSTLTISAPGVLGNDADDGIVQPLAAVLEADASYGTLTLNADGSFAYEPAAGWSGADSFMYVAFDGQYGSSPTLVTLTVQSRLTVVIDANQMNTNELRLVFSKPVTSVSAQALANYSMDNGIDVLSAVLLADQVTVLLTTTPMTEGQPYQLTMDGVVATDGIAIAPATLVSFTCELPPFHEYAYRAAIQLSGYDRSETLTNFPLLVKLGPDISGFDYTQFDSPFGFDLRFSDNTLTNELTYEIESWDTNGTSFVWVQVPTVAGTGTVVQAYWGNAGAVLAPDYTTSGAVWDDGFLGVYHMNGTANDSTANRIHAMPENGAVATEALLAGGYALSGGAHLDLGNSAIWDRMDKNTKNAWTMSMWFKPNSIATDNTLIARFTATTAPGFLWWMDAGAYPNYVFYDSQGSRTPETTGIRSVSNVWQYVTARKAGANIEVYVNGVFSGSCVGDLDPTTLKLSIGSDHGDSTGRTINGTVDEARLSDVTRSADWIWAEYMNMAFNDTFCVYGGVVDTHPSATHSLTVAASGHGSIEPSGIVLVPSGGATNFVITASNYWHIASILTNGVDVGGCSAAIVSTNIVWSNVMADGTLQVTFAEQTTSNGVPCAWLAAQESAWTNDFEAAAADDPDGDGMVTWQEYIAGTDPRLATSVFQITSNALTTAGSQFILQWPSASGRTYCVQYSTNLLQQGFVELWTNIPATPPMNTHTGAAAPGPAFYRIDVIKGE